ncbi:hypothetical protein [Actinocorallia sp. A-T 12471]|uniref:hypothetical protein n=1 Tax=Actinocorallia sp. A-T 12471 TaxID=3089813 RepID=UPI0029D0CE97|nr:hypothetical protein [Actinocorallia sp. A-T 12471]MDX6740095.1 hypothetical protein [Actinocorallia sp. A-T 12471]
MEVLSGEPSGRRHAVPEGVATPVGIGIGALVTGVWMWLERDARGAVADGVVAAVDARSAARQVAEARQRPDACVVVRYPRKVRHTGPKPRKNKGNTVMRAAGPPNPAVAAEALRLADLARAELPADRIVPGAVTWTRPGEEYSPYLVAADASFAGEDSAWACVTGAGWVLRGALRTPHIGHAELLAVERALSLYPDHADVTVLTDSVAAASVIAQLRAGKPAREVLAARPWLTEARASVVVGVLAARLTGRSGAVRVRRVPRDTHPLHRQADREARLARKESDELTGAYRRRMREDPDYAAREFAARKPIGLAEGRASGWAIELPWLDGDRTSVAAIQQVMPGPDGNAIRYWAAVRGDGHARFAASAIVSGPWPIRSELHLLARAAELLEPADGPTRIVTTGGIYSRATAQAVNRLLAVTDAPSLTRMQGHYPELRRAAQALHRALPRIHTIRDPSTHPQLAAAQALLTALHALLKAGADYTDALAASLAALLDRAAHGPLTPSRIQDAVHEALALPESPA